VAARFIPPSHWPDLKKVIYCFLLSGCVLGVGPEIKGDHDTYRVRYLHNPESGGIASLDLDDPSQLAGAVIPHRVDDRRAGTMTEHLLALVEGSADAGLSRGELKTALLASKFRENVLRNENGYYNAIKRCLNRTEIVEVGRRLYHPSKAPDPQKAETANTLFSVTQSFSPKVN
jgi:hypothetical protein